MRTWPWLQMWKYYGGIRRVMSAPIGRLLCEVEGESLERYKLGGYHPVQLGDYLKGGRYKIIHKLGWGGYATTWLATDQCLNRLVAVKIKISEAGPHLYEADIYSRLGGGSEDNPGRGHILLLLDDFALEGPNGTHGCLVSEVLGASVATAAERYKSNRLPGKIAWQVARQVTCALAYMHQTGIVHGDLHPGNILFAHSESEIRHALDTPERADVQAVHGKSLMPKYMVQCATLPQLSGRSQTSVKLIDFGSSFVSSEPSPKMRCPLPYRAPEAVLTKRWDTPADIWSLGCTIFALVVGYSPFDSFLNNESELISEWMASFGQLPSEWDYELFSLKSIEPAELDTADISEWLRETYYDDGKQPFFTESDLDAISDLLLLMFRYRPAERPTAEDLLQHPLLRTDPFATR